MLSIRSLPLIVSYTFVGVAHRVTPFLNVELLIPDFFANKAAVNLNFFPAAVIEHILEDTKYKTSPSVRNIMLEIFCISLIVCVSKCILYSKRSILLK
jgi:hypothetical protein